MSGEKTEQPTGKKLRDARKRGEVPFSKELPSAALVLALLGLLVATSGPLLQQFQTILRLPVAVLDQDASVASDTLLRAYSQLMMSILAPVFGTVIVVGIAACVGQTGVLLAFEGAKPSMKKLNPAQWFTKTFGIENAIELLKSIIKVSVLGLVIWFLVRDGLQAMVTAPTCGLPCLQQVMGKLLVQTVLWSAGPLIVVAAADVMFQRWQFTRKNMMTKDEVKREYKESEGDPQVKGMRKQLHQQLLAEGKVDRARTATVLVTNPTHVAVAVRYVAGETPLPVVTAMGTDQIAKRMMAAAEQAGVPIMRNVPLARGLLEQAEVDQYIPSDLIDAFAEVLRALQTMNQA